MRSAVVTGAANGIGLAVSNRLVSDGYFVVGVDVDDEGLAAAQARLGARFEPVVGDISQWESHEMAADRAERAADLHAWINNAAVDWTGGAHEIDADHIQRGLSVLQQGPMFGCCVAVRRMLKHSGGVIVNVSSIQGIAAFPRYFVYETAKSALLMATKSIAVDYGPHGIRCNALLPGTIETAMTLEAYPEGVSHQEILRQEAQLSPMGRVGRPDEMAEIVMFLVSENSSYINGASIVADGGATARAFAYPPIAL